MSKHLVLDGSAEDDETHVDVKARGHVYREHA
jgi:hypothetical protein